MCQYLISRESHAYALDANFLLKEVLLVEEDDEGHFREKLVVDNVLEKVKTFVHPIDAPVLYQHLVVFRHGHHEQHAVHVVENVDPFFALRTLSANIEHVKDQTLILELNLQMFLYRVRTEMLSSLVVLFSN